MKPYNKREMTDAEVIRLGKRASRIGKEIEKSFVKNKSIIGTSVANNDYSELCITCKNGDVFIITIEAPDPETLIPPEALKGGE